MSASIPNKASLTELTIAQLEERETVIGYSISRSLVRTWLVRFFALTPEAPHHQVKVVPGKGDARLELGSEKKMHMWKGMGTTRTNSRARVKRMVSWQEARGFRANYIIVETKVEREPVSGERGRRIRLEGQNGKPNDTGDYKQKKCSRMNRR